LHKAQNAENDELKTIQDFEHYVKTA